jgi:hypothetical protein
VRKYNWNKIRMQKIHKKEKDAASWSWELTVISGGAKGRFLSDQRKELNLAFLTFLCSFLPFFVSKT